MTSKAFCQALFLSYVFCVGVVSLREGAAIILQARGDRPMTAGAHDPTHKAGREVKPSDLQKFSDIYIHMYVYSHIPCSRIVSAIFTSSREDKKQYII